MDEVAVADDSGSISAEEIRDGNTETREVCTAADKADDWHNDIVDEGSDDSTEGSTDDDTDGKVHDVTLANECFKFFDKFILAKFFHNT